MSNPMHAMLCVKLDICFVVEVVSRFQSNPRLEHWTYVIHILKYLRRMIKYMLMCLCDELVLLRYKCLNFLFDEDSCRSTSRVCVHSK